MSTRDRETGSLAEASAAAGRIAVPNRAASAARSPSSTDQTGDRQAADAASGDELAARVALLEARQQSLERRLAHLQRKVTAAFEEPAP